jgi:acetolactate synthase-1/2/3 large subunit
VRAFVEAMPAPLVATSKARGVLPDPHPLALGQLGGAEEAELLARADLVVALGEDLLELETIAWRWPAPVLHLGRAGARGAPYAPAVEVIGPIGLTLEELASRLRDRARADWDLAELARMKRRLDARQAPAEPAPRIVELVRDLTPPGTTAVFESRWLPATSRWLCVSPGDLLGPGALGSGGFALPASIAARLARPDRDVVCFTDAPGLLRSLAELETAARLRVGIVIVVMGARGPALVPLAQALGVTAVSAGSEALLTAHVGRALRARERIASSRAVPGFPGRLRASGGFGGPFEAPHDLGGDRPLLIDASSGPV